MKIFILCLGLFILCVFCFYYKVKKDINKMFDFNNDEDWWSYGNDDDDDELLSDTSKNKSK